MQVRILGPLEVATTGGRFLPLGGPRQQVVLSVLALESGRTVSVDRLIDAVWDDAPPPTARRQIRICISAIRRCFGTTDGLTITTQTSGYCLPLPQGALDSQQFGHLVAKAQQAVWNASPIEAVADLRTALQLWRGPALAGVASRIVQASTLRLEEARLGATEERIRLDLVLGRHQQVIGETISLAMAEPFRENVQAYLMLALHRSGRPAEALEVYRRTRIRFIEELGLEPSGDLQRMHSDILNHDPHLGLPAVCRAAEAHTPSQAETTKTVQVLPSGAIDPVGHEAGIATVDGGLDEEAHPGQTSISATVVPVPPAFPVAADLPDPASGDGRPLDSPPKGQDSHDTTRRIAGTSASTSPMQGHTLADQDSPVLGEELVNFISRSDKASCGLVLRLLGEVNRVKGQAALATENWASEEREGRSRTAELTQRLIEAQTTASAEHALRQAAQAGEDVALARCSDLGERLFQSQQPSGINRALRDRAFAQRQVAEANAVTAAETATCAHDQFLWAKAELAVAADRLTEQKERTAEARADLAHQRTVEGADRRLAGACPEHARAEAPGRRVSPLLALRRNQ